MKKLIVLIMIIPVIIGLFLAIGLKRTNPVLAFLHDDSDLIIEPVEINATVKIKGTLHDNGYFTVIIPDEWTYEDWRDDLTDSKPKMELIDQTAEEYLSTYHGALATRYGVTDYLDSGYRNPATIVFNFMPASIKFVDETKREVNPKEPVKITVNGRIWEGYHGLLNNFYICNLVTKDDDYVLRISVSRGKSSTFSLNDDDFLVILASMHYTGE